MSVFIIPTQMALDCQEYIEADTGLSVTVTGEMIKTFTESQCIAGADRIEPITQSAMMPKTYQDELNRIGREAGEICKRSDDLYAFMAGLIKMDKERLK
jgi:hypothetical protein